MASAEPFTTGPTHLNMTSAIRDSATAALRRLQQGSGKSAFELVYTPHDRWPLPRSRTKLPSRPLRISILDSSFNPPTLAHLALASSRRPTYPTSISRDNDDYDARLLLLSVKNADKSPKHGDATYLQRLEMMALLAKDVITQNSDFNPSSNAADSEESNNLAVAIIDEPRFVHKSTLLLEHLENIFPTFSPPLPAHRIQLTFLLGFDTLERLFSPRYYPSATDMTTSLKGFLSLPPKGDDSYIVCAHRTFAADDITHSDESSALKAADEFVQSSRITFIDIGEKERTYSSSAVRSAIGRLTAESDGTQEGWRSFVTTKIADYILKSNLYIDQ